MEMNFAIFKPALERQIQSWFWMNNFMRPWILSLEKLVEVHGNDIVIDLVGFNERYTDRYFKGQIDQVAPRMIDQVLKDNLAHFLKHTGYQGYVFQIIIRGRGMSYTKTLNVKNPDWE